MTNRQKVPLDRLREQRRPFPDFDNPSITFSYFSGFRGGLKCIKINTKVLSNWSKKEEAVLDSFFSSLDRLGTPKRDPKVIQNTSRF